MKVQTALGILVAVLFVAPGCGSDNPQAQSGSGGRGVGGGAGNGSGGSGVGGNAGNNVGGGAGSGSGGSAGNGAGGIALGGSGGGSGGVKTGGTTGSGGNATGGAGGNSMGGGGNPDSAAGGTGAGGSTARDGGRDTIPGVGGGGENGGGATGTGGSTGAGGSTNTDAGSGGQNICTFASGLNVAWVQFAGDVPNTSSNIATFNTIFKNTYDSGGRIVRWWFHTNGTVTPGYQTDGTAQKLPQSHIDGLKAILSAANTNKLGVVVSLWSFDMLQGPGSGENIPSGTLTNNQKLITQDTNRQAYIDNYLTPLVTALKGTPGLYAYEIFNEPEGMSTENGWTANSSNQGLSVPESAIQKTVNWFAAAIHAADPRTPVTNGSQTMDYRTLYTDSALTSAGGKSTGTLDFYEVHYYQVNGSNNDVFANPRSHWAMSDKKLAIGEFAAYSQDTSPVAVNDCYTYLYSNGYDGAWAWSYTEGNSNYAWPSMQTPMKNLLAAHADVGTCP